MAISVSNTFTTPAGFDMFTLFDDMAEGVYSTSAAGTEVITFTFGLQTLSFHGTFTESSVSVTGFSLKVGASNEIFSTSGAGTEIYSTSSMGTEYAALPAEFAAAYVSDMKMTFTGSASADVGWGTNSKDSLFGKGGDDILLAGRGADVVKGGNGDDFASGGRGKDTLLGQNGHDLLRGEQGDDKIKGGTGNDLIEGGIGNNKTWGGAGIDVFIFDAGKVGRTVVKDYDLSDIILITGVASSAGSNPDGVRVDLAGGTFADIDKGDISGLTIKETGAGHLKIAFGDQTVILRNTTAAQVELDQLYFTDPSSDTVLANYGGPSSVKIGGAIEGSDLIAEPNGFITYGAESTTFITYGAESTTYADFL